MPAQIGPVIRKKVKAKVRRPAPTPSRSDAAQRTGAQTPKPPQVKGPPAPVANSRSDAAQRRGATTPTKPKVLLRRSRRQAKRDHIGLNPDRATGKKRGTKSVDRAIAKAERAIATKKGFDAIREMTTTQNGIGDILDDIGREANPYTNDVYIPSTGGGVRPLGVSGGGSRIATALSPGGVNLKGTNSGLMLSRIFKDGVDLPANVVTSGYLTGKTLVEDGPVAAGKSVVDPIVYTIKHPKEAFTEHPLNSVLMATGVKSSAGRGTGKVMRTVPSKTTRRLASVGGREAKIVPGTGRVVPRRYSKDVSTKAVQVAVDRRRAKRRVKRGEDPRPVARGREVDRAIDEDFQAEKIITQRNQGEIAGRARDAVAPKKGRGPRGRKRPTAATSLAAQGIINPSRADLAAYLTEVRSQAPRLQGTRLARNKETQRLIEKALKDFDPVEVRRAAEEYSKLAAELDAKVIDAGLLTAKKAEQTRYESVRARRVKRGSNPETDAPRIAASRDRNVKKKEADKALAEYDLAIANAKLAQRGRKVPAKNVAEVQRAAVRRDATREAYEVARDKAADTKLAHIKAHADGDPAYVSHQSIEPRDKALQVDAPEIPVKIKRKGPAVKEGSLDVHPAKLVEQAIGTQRIVDGAAAQKRLIAGWGYRKTDGGRVEQFSSTVAAGNFAEKTLDGDWQPARLQDGEYALVPTRVAARLNEHAAGVNAKHPLVRAAGAQWRLNVLAYSPRWLAGNVIEGAVRSVVAGAGPVSYITAKKTLNRLDPETRQMVEARTTGGGNLTQADRLASDPALTREAKDIGRIGTALYKFRQKPVARHLTALHGAYTNFVMRDLSGRIENQFQTVMLGKALRDHPLMSKRVVNLSNKAVQEAADGLRDTDTMAELGRAVDDMYGRYTKFSPGMAKSIANYTPFLAWTYNAVNFLYHVMPRDHPVMTGLLASMSVATEDARKAIGSYYDTTGDTEGQLPPYLQGSIPGKDGSNLRVSRYMPFGIFNDGLDPTSPLEGLSGLLLPELSEIGANVLHGEDWKGKELNENDQDFLRGVMAGVTTFIEGQVPGAHLGVAVSGVKLPNEADEEDRVVPALKVRARKAADPFQYTPATGFRATETASASSSSSSSGPPKLSELMSGSSSTSSSASSSSAPPTLKELMGGS